jgi:nucleoside phosphorylase
LSDDKTEPHVLFALLPAMGISSATAVTTHARRSFPSIEQVLMVGIAGGCPNPDRPAEHVRLGDIVVSDEKGIVEYGHVKLTQEGREFRSAAQRPSAKMLHAFKHLMMHQYFAKRPWEQHLARALPRADVPAKFARPTADKDILHAYGGTRRRGRHRIIMHPCDPDRRPDQPKVHGGAIGTADILLKEPRLRDELRDKFGVRAVEMEGSGIQAAGWIAGLDVFVVRGICDYCDASKNDEWQHYAALVAAAFARALMEALPLEWFR